MRGKEEYGRHQDTMDGRWYGVWVDVDEYVLRN